jgi:hypothetical protein
MEETPMQELVLTATGFLWIIAPFSSSPDLTFDAMCHPARTSAQILGITPNETMHFNGWREVDATLVIHRKTIDDCKRRI